MSSIDAKMAARVLRWARSEVAAGRLTYDVVALVDSETNTRWKRDRTSVTVATSPGVSGIEVVVRGAPGQVTLLNVPVRTALAVLVALGLIPAWLGLEPRWTLTEKAKAVLGA